MSEKFQNCIEIVEQLRAGKKSCKEHTKNYLDKINEKNKQINCFLELNKKVLEQAKELDRKQRRQEKLGKFFGLCFAIKCNLSVEDMTISSASKVLENYKGTYDSDVTTKIKQEDGLIIGITNADEFAAGSTGGNSAFGKTQNPLSIGRIPGGSSSGSAACISANMCDVAIGTDTGGSIRTPAAHCGVIGIKTTYGLLSRQGLSDLSMSLDTIGTLTNDVTSSEYILNILSEKTQKAQSKEFNIQKTTIGIIPEFENHIEDEEILQKYKEVIKELEKRGATIKKINIKFIDLGVEAYYPIVFTEFFSATQKFDGIKYGKKFEEKAGVEALRRVFGGREISRAEFKGAYYKKALQVKNLLSKSFEESFKEVDYIISPTTPKLAHKFEDKLSTKEEYAYDIFTTPISLAGNPSGVIPFKFKKGEENFSIGFQVVAEKFQEEKMFKLMRFLEKLKL